MQSWNCSTTCNPHDYGSRLRAQVLLVKSGPDLPRSLSPNLASPHMIGGGIGVRGGIRGGQSKQKVWSIGVGPRTPFTLKTRTPDNCVRLEIWCRFFQVCKEVSSAIPGFQKGFNATEVACFTLGSLKKVSHLGQIRSLLLLMIYVISAFQGKIYPWSIRSAWPIDHLAWWDSYDLYDIIMCFMGWILYNPVLRSISQRQIKRSL